MGRLAARLEQGHDAGATVASYMEGMCPIPPQFPCTCAARRFLTRTGHPGTFAAVCAFCRVNRARRTTARETAPTVAGSPRREADLAVTVIRNVALEARSLRQECLAANLLDKVAVAELYRSLGGPAAQ